MTGEAPSVCWLRRIIKLVKERTEKCENGRQNDSDDASDDGDGGGGRTIATTTTTAAAASGQYVQPKPSCGDDTTSYTYTGDLEGPGGNSKIKQQSVTQKSYLQNRAIFCPHTVYVYG